MNINREIAHILQSLNHIHIHMKNNTMIFIKEVRKCHLDKSVLEHTLSRSSTVISNPTIDPFDNETKSILKAHTCQKGSFTRGQTTKRWCFPYKVAC